MAKLVSAWGAVHNRIYIWDYNVNFSHYLAPMPNLDVMAANIRFWMKNHAEGVMLQGGYQGPAERDQLKCWVTAKLLWNPAWDEKALARDFIQGHYGKAAPAIEEYEALLERMRADHASEMASPRGRHPLPDGRAVLHEGVRGAGDGRSLPVPGSWPPGDEALTAARRARRVAAALREVRARPGVCRGQTMRRWWTEFERIARREKMQFLQEGGPDFEPKLAGYKSRIPKPAAAR